MITFTVPAVPVAQPRQRQRVVKGKGGKIFAHNYTPTKHPANAFKATARMAAQQAYDGSPLQGPVYVSMLFVMPRPKAMQWKRKPMPREWHDKKPDCDNLVKAILDALNGLMWGDDCQVSAAPPVKVIASGDEQPHVEVAVMSLEDISPDVFLTVIQRWRKEEC